MKRVSTLILSLMMATWIQAQIIQSENFNSCALPAGWTENIVSGTAGWLFVLNSPDALNAGNLDGTCMVMFDDDFLGSAAAPSTAQLISPPVDITGLPLVLLDFDYNLQEYGPAIGDGITVEVWDGASWISVFSRLDINDCGSWACGPPYPHASIDVTAYANPGFQTRITYDDGGDWSWYVGFDNFVLFTPPSDDLGVTAVLQPIEGGCSLSASEPVQVSIENFGSADATGFDVCFQIDGPGGLVTICENVGALNITAGSSANYLFTATADLSLAGEYTVTGYTALVGDGIAANDSTSVMLDLNLITPLYNENFNAYPDLTTVFPDFTNEVDDQRQWEVNFGTTPSAGTGPTTDATGGGGYLFIESSGSVAGDSAVLTSRCIDLTGTSAPVLEFAYHMFGPAIDFLRVEVVDGVGTATEVLKLVGQQQFANADPWLNALVDLSPWAGSVVQVRFTGKIKLGSDGFTFTADMALDEITFREISGDDLGVTDILAPILGGCLLSSSENIAVEIGNFGSSDQTSFSVCYLVDGPTGLFSACENVGALSVTALGGTGNYTFVGSVDFSLPGIYTITSYTDLGSDGEHANDTSTVVLNIPAPVSLPLEDNFDVYTTGATAFTTGLSNSTADDRQWQVLSGPTSSIGTGPNVDAGGSGKYIYIESSGTVIGDVAILETQCLDLTASLNPVVRYAYHMVGGSIDSLVLEAIAGSTATPLVILDKQQQLLEADPWRDTLVDLSAFTGQVIRLQWKGFIRADPIDGITTFRGDIALDNIIIEDPLPDDAGVIAITSPFDGCDPGSSATVSVVLENFGSTSVSGFDVSFSVNGGSVTTENVGGLSLAPGATAPYTFAGTADLSADGFYDLLAWTDLAGDANSANDSTAAVVENYTGISSFPYTETFDAFSNCGDALFGCALDLSCSGSVAGGWTQEAGDDIDWSITNLLTTPSIGTGPSAGDHTSGTGRYLFTESSGCNGQAASIVSHCFDLSAVTCPQVSFWYHMLGTNQGTLSLEIDPGTGVWTSIWSLSGDQGNAWFQASVSLDAYLGQTVRFRLVGLTGPGFLSDMAIDDFSISDNGLDVAVASVESPSSGCEVGLTNVTVTLFNASCLPAPAFDAVLEINGSIIVTDTYPAGLAGLAAASHVFTVPFDFAAIGAYSIKAYTVLAGDANAINDTAFAVVSSVLPPVVNTGFSTNYCDGTSTYLPSPLIPGGTWSGTGIINPTTGEFDPALVGAGNSTNITYTFTPTGDYSVAAIAYAPETVASPIAVALGDDDDITVPIGFPFEFFGNSYSNIIIHSNGFLTFSSDLNPTVAQTLPNPTEPNDLIAVVWDDWNPNDGGSITYATVGSVPNRRWIVTYSNLPHFGSAGGSTMTVQAILYEGSNNIDFQITEISSDGGSRTQGIENASGTEAYTSTPGTNFSDFTQLLEAYRYSPTPCGASVTETITIDLPYDIGLAADTTLCFGTSGVLDAGPGASSYSWSTGATTQTITVSTEGTYSVSIIDPLGCLATDEIEVFIANEISIGGTKTNVDCAGENTGAFTVVPSGGTAPYTYLWNTGATTANLSALAGGVYTVTVTDANGCSATAEKTIGEPEPLVVTLEPVDSDFGANNGKINAVVSGGRAPYTYLWSDGQTTKRAIDLAPGVYSVTVTDSAGCESTESIEVGEASGLGWVEGLQVFDLFPNPSSGEVQLNVVMQQASDMRVDIYNAVGQLVLSLGGEKTSSKLWNIDLTTAAAGSYQIRLIIDGQVLVRPLVIAR
ncbi:MAG: T9SS type A sorting domain-containing protein [Bacteroidetes bacterium]|nr:T9SS type A sorting domain-containing protein [Bacteroidota bacterium]